MRVFDELIANTDRNQGNMLIDRDWKLWLIDHSRAFRLNETLHAPMHVRRCDRALLTQMKALTRKAVDEELGDYLTSSEREALLGVAMCWSDWSNRSDRRRSTTATRHAHSREPRRRGQGSW